MTAVDILIIVATMIGGLALFMTGMDTLSESLTALTGGTFKRVIANLTKNRYFAFALGAVITAVVQSSSAITVLSVGLVNTGFIELSKAAGLIIGANLGTTATAWVLSLNALDGESLIMTMLKPSTFSPFLAIIAVAMKMFCKTDKKKTVGSVILGFAVMMIGMNLMSQAVSPLKEIPAIRETLVSFSNPILGFLFACALAMLIQSSDAVIGIIQAFALAVGVTFGMAIPLICGAQVGTCVTAMLSSLGTSNNGKRAALLNLYYNLLKTIPFMVGFYLINYMVGFSFLADDVGGAGIPVFHTLVNLLGCIVWLPQSNLIVSLANRTIPLSEKEKQDQANTLTMLDKNLLGNPSFAAEQAYKAVNLLAKTVGDAFLAVNDILLKRGDSEQVEFLCERAEKFQNQIEEYLLRISEKDIGMEERAYLQLLSSANVAFGRMSKAALRMMDMTDKLMITYNEGSEMEQRELKIMGESIYEIIQLTIKGFDARSKTVSQTIRCYREEVTELTSITKLRYIRRVHEVGKDMRLENVYSDISHCQEQLIDYCDMVADALIRYYMEIGGSGETFVGVDDRIRKQIHMLFIDKYEALGIRPEERTSAERGEQ